MASSNAMYPADRVINIVALMDIEVIDGIE